METSYGGVSLRGVGGAVAVRNQSGAVSVRGLSGEALRGQHQIETSYADIDFSWPASQRIDFRLESTYGQIRSGIPGTLRENGSRRTMEGGPGGSPARLTLVAKAGSVRLETE